MAKVVDFSSIQKDAEKEKRRRLNPESLKHYRDMLEGQIFVMDRLFSQLEEAIREANLNPAVFTLEEESAKNFLAKDLEAFFTGNANPMELSYNAVIRKVHYKAYATANVIDEFVSFDSYLLKWDGEEWLDYCVDDWYEEFVPARFQNDKGPVPVDDVTKNDDDA